MKIGCHISTRKGLLETAKTAVRLGAGSFQYFPKNPRSLAVKSYLPADGPECAQYCAAEGLVSIAHSPYPTNLAAEGELRQATVASLRNDLAIADHCGSLGVVVHFGKYKGKDPLQGYKNIIQCLNEVLNGYAGRALLLIENQAGEGTAMGTTLEELVQVRTLSSRPELIGFCLDTCHAFASGLWPSGPDGWKRLEERAVQLGYWDHLRAVHLNDSVYPGGAGKDRHANIGTGEMGRERFREMLTSPSIKGRVEMPAVLETSVPNGGTHAAEIAYVKELASR
ncbi:deoxyribonuclease IV [Paenibacillus filicis]|uniref:Deoxyribonuclease IV n=1 Tax=Paenibacillus gyeongsangnamensis TaxID=3388067 RepID=A0ABT4QG45_9BACL|nr:deoxyribonuclease IV [Paenibacillus filicis]MCZ8515862.1 deoxyribonuclease IV [Paenibacillus filicis]